MLKITFFTEHFWWLLLESSRKNVQSNHKDSSVNKNHIIPFSISFFNCSTSPSFNTQKTSGRRFSLSPCPKEAVSFAGSKLNQRYSNLSKGGIYGEAGLIEPNELEREMLPSRRDTAYKKLKKGVLVSAKGSSLNFAFKISELKRFNSRKILESKFGNDL